MNAPPEANTEYSRGSGPSRRLVLPRWHSPDSVPAPPSEGAASVESAPSVAGSGAAQRPGADHPARSSERRAAPSEPSRAAAGAVALLALLGAVLVLVAQFTALYRVHSTTSSAAIKSVGTGANHAWAPLPLALLAAVLAVAVLRSGSRPAAAAIAALGIATLGIALLGDLPDVHSSGLIGSSAGGYIQAVSSPSAGLYMETLGAVVLLIAGGVGLLMPVAPTRRTA